jgi:hypothetical protein
MQVCRRNGGNEMNKQKGIKYKEKLKPTISYNNSRYAFVGWSLYE